MIVDLFAGPGGWDEGARIAGYAGPLVGLEWEKAACETAVAAGHARIRCDVAAYPVEPFIGKVEGLIASPPCQCWSAGGLRLGEHDRHLCHQLAERMALDGDDSIDWTEWTDPRSALVCQPIRWARELVPRWIALEEVPGVAPLWEHFARILQGWGYSTWSGVVRADEYGVPQTRTRALLLASLDRKVSAPVPTHSRWPELPAEAGLFGDELQPWVSMADALGWSGDDLVGFPRRADTPSNRAGSGVLSIDGVDYRSRDMARADRPALVLSSKARSWIRMGNAANATVRPVEAPAPTVLFGHRANAVEWFEENPRVASGEKHRVSVSEAGVLQSFPAGYPWRGSMTRQFEQVGNAVPPLLAAAALRVVLPH